jgi:hypothetical protein
MRIVVLDTIAASVSTGAWWHQGTWRLDKMNSIVDVGVGSGCRWRNGNFEVLRLSIDRLRRVVGLLGHIIAAMTIRRLNDRRDE